MAGGMGLNVRFGAEVDQLIQGFRKVETETGKMSRQIEGLAGAFQTLAGMELTSTLFSAFQGGVQVLAGFEQSMNGIAAIAGESQESLGKLEAQIRDLGLSTKFSASEVANASKELIASGFNAQQAGEALAATLNLSNAGALDAARAAEVMSSTINSFGLSTKDAAMVVDQFAMVANKSSAGINDIGETMKYVGGVATAMKVPIDQMSTAIGILANNGIKGSEAGTQLRAILASIAKPTGEAAKVFDRMGVSLDVLEKEGMPGMIRRMQEANISVAEMTTVFGREALPAINALVKTGEKGFRELNQDILDAEGSAQKMADTMSKGLAGEMQRFGSIMEALFNTLKDSGALDAMTAAVQKLNDGLSYLIKEQPRLVQFVTTFAGIATGIATVGAGLATAAVAAKTFGVAMGMSLGPVSAAVVALSAAITGTIMLFDALASKADKALVQSAGGRQPQLDAYAKNVQTRNENAEIQLQQLGKTEEEEQKRREIIAKRVRDNNNLMLELQKEKQNFDKEIAGLRSFAAMEGNPSGDRNIAQANADRLQKYSDDLQAKIKEVSARTAIYRSQVGEAADIPDKVPVQAGENAFKKVFEARMEARQKELDRLDMVLSQQMSIDEYFTKRLSDDIVSLQASDLLSPSDMGIFRDLNEIIAQAAEDAGDENVFDPYIGKLGEQMKAIGGIFDQGFNELQQVGLDAIEGVFGALGDALMGNASVEESLKALGTSLLGALGDILGDMGKALIGVGLGIKAFQESLKSMQWYAALAVGAALVGLSAAFKAVAKKGSTSMASYSSPAVSSGGGGGGSYGSNTRPPEYFGQLSGFNDQTIELKVKGTDLVAVLDKQATKRNM